MKTPEDIVYVNMHDSIILNCQAGGTPTPEILWYKGDKSVRISNRLGVFNDGTELRINNLREKDLGDYTCIARNGVNTKDGQTQVHFTIKVVMAGKIINVEYVKYNENILHFQ